MDVRNMYITQFCTQIKSQMKTYIYKVIAETYINTSNFNMADFSAYMVKASNFSTSITIQSRREAWTEKAIYNLNKTIKRLYVFGLKKAI